MAFVCGNTKVLPKGVSVKGQLSIPRAELNAARDLAEKVLEVETELDLPNPHPTIYYSDSEDVLAWIRGDTPNQTQPRYIVSRVTYIRKVSNPKQWYYVPTLHNPADIGTRPITVKDLQASPWLTGPQFLFLNNPEPPTTIPTTSSTTLFTATVSAYFLTHLRTATEDITSGSMWKNRLEQTH